MKTWMATYVNEIGNYRKVWFHAKTLIHACAIARKLLPANPNWAILNVERRY